MKRYSALIIDDERLARSDLRRKLEAYPEIEVIGEASSVASGTEAITELRPDILFLDIQLSDGLGFDILNNVEFTGKTIFVTAYDEYACRAFEINAVDYILKPFSKERLHTAIAHLLNPETEHERKTSVKFRYDDIIMIEQKKSIHFVRIESIICIKAEREYTTVFERGGRKYLVLKSIGEWQTELPDQQFARVHRNAIINFNHISSSEKTGNTAKVFLSGIDNPVSISRGYYKLLKNRYFYK
jgi:two-component system, LytTR family, response regulator